MMPNLMFWVHLDGVAHKKFQAMFSFLWLLASVLVRNDHLVWNQSILASVKDLIYLNILLELGPQSSLVLGREKNQCG